MTTPPTQSEIDKAIEIIKSDAILAGNAAIAERMTKMEERLNRLPVSEMTPEEKAAAYDKLMADKNKPEPPASPEPPKGPVPPEPKPPEPPKVKRDAYWGDALN